MRLSRRRIIPALAALALVAGAPGRAHAAPGFLWTGGEVFARFLSSEAAYDDNLYLWNKGGGANLFLFDNQTGAAAGTVGFSPGSFGYAAGDELVFLLRVFTTQTGTAGETAGTPAFTWYSLPGMNADGAAHAQFAALGGGDTGMNWEDLPAAQWTGGEGDFNDMRVAVSVTPEPVSMALLGTGLAGLAGFRRRRRRESAES
jgi:hypothetical protein